MGDKIPMKTIFNRLGSEKPREFPHLRPLSIYARMISCDTQSAGSGSSLSSNKDSCSNINIKIMNDCSVSAVRKRQMDDSCFDETYETPQKRPCLPACHSPDLACVLDSFLLGEKNGTPECSLVDEKANKIEEGTTNNSTFTENTSKARGPPLVKPTSLVLKNGSDESDCQSSPSLSFSEFQASSPLIHSSKNIGDHCPAFDFDLDEILCLSPIDCIEGQPDSDGQGDFLQSCQSFSEERLHPLNEPCSRQGSFHKQSAESCIVETKEGGKNTGSANDEGYFTKSFKAAELKESKYIIPSEMVTPVMSTPLEKFRLLVKRSLILKRLGKLEQSLPLLSQEPAIASSPISLYGSMNLDGMNAEIVSEIPFLDSSKNIERKFRSVDAAIQNSLVGHNEKLLPVVADIVEQLEEAKVVPPLKAAVDADTVKQVEKAKVVPPLRAPFFTDTVKLVEKAKVVPPFQAPVVADTVKQVKEARDVPSVSKQVNLNFKRTFLEVVCPATKSTAPLLRPDEKTKTAVRATSSASTTISAQQPERKDRGSGDQKKVLGQVQRPVVFCKEEDWERQRKVYVESVVRHMQDKGQGAGVVNELHNLMDTVANQRDQKQGRQWQHPSDLTRRNYQLRHTGNSFSLDEWQNLNYRYHRRFAHVPNPFRRSPVP